jgi:hypothetical protein
MGLQFTDGAAWWVLHAALYKVSSNLAAIHQLGGNMSKVLSGRHYCKDHQGNNSHYDSDNCELCQAIKSSGEMKYSTKIISDVAKECQHQIENSTIVAVVGGFLTGILLLSLIIIFVTHFWLS